MSCECLSGRSGASSSSSFRKVISAVLLLSLSECMQMNLIMRRRQLLARRSRFNPWLSKSSVLAHSTYTFDFKCQTFVVWVQLSAGVIGLFTEHCNRRDSWRPLRPLGPASAVYSGEQQAGGRRAHHHTVRRNSQHSLSAAVITVTLCVCRASSSPPAQASSRVTACLLC